MEGLEPSVISIAAIFAVTRNKLHRAHTRQVFTEINTRSFEKSQIAGVRSDEVRHLWFYVGEEKLSAEITSEGQQGFYTLAVRHDSRDDRALRHNTSPCKSALSAPRGGTFLERYAESHEYPRLGTIALTTIQSGILWMTQVQSILPSNRDL